MLLMNLLKGLRMIASSELKLCQEQINPLTYLHMKIKNLKKQGFVIYAQRLWEKNLIKG